MFAKLILVILLFADCTSPQNDRPKLKGAKGMGRMFDLHDDRDADSTTVKPKVKGAKGMGRMFDLHEDRDESQTSEKPKLKGAKGMGRMFDITGDLEDIPIDPEEPPQASEPDEAITEEEETTTTTTTTTTEEEEKVRPPKPRTPKKKKEKECKDTSGPVCETKCGSVKMEIDSSVAFLDIGFPQHVVSGQEANQEWNHCKYQMDSCSSKSCDQSCDTSCRRGCQSCDCGLKRDCCGDDSSDTMKALHQLWNRFSLQKRSGNRFAANNLVENSLKKLIIKLDVEHFRPNEIQVKVIGKEIVVIGEHEERTDRMGRVSRRFQRKFDLAEEVDVESIESKICSSKGVLTIEATKSRIPSDSNEIVIPVNREDDNSDDPLEHLRN